MFLKWRFGSKMTNTPRVLCVDCCVTFKFLRQSLLNAALIKFYSTWIIDCQMMCASFSFGKGRQQAWGRNCNTCKNAIGKVNNHPIFSIDDLNNTSPLEFKWWCVGLSDQKTYSRVTLLAKISLNVSYHWSQLTPHPPEKKSYQTFYVFMNRVFF